MGREGEGEGGLRGRQAIDEAAGSLTPTLSHRERAPDGGYALGRPNRREVIAWAMRPRGWTMWRAGPPEATTSR